MATETKIRVTRARYGGFVATFNWQGDWCRIFFENQLDLAQELVDCCVDRETRDAVIDTYEQLEWDETPEYPLGVSYRPVAEVACYEPPYDGECNCEVCVPRRPVKPTTLWDWIATTTWLGAVAAPWVAIVILVRWAGGW